MDEHQKILVRMALSYMLSNLDDVADAFRCESDDPNHPAYGSDSKVEFRGEIIERPSEQEITDIIDSL